MTTPPPGARLVDSHAEAFDADLVVKVKEPLPEEFPLLRSGQILFTYLHLAASLDLTAALLKSGGTAIAYETVTRHNRLPLLEPMSEIAGRMSVIVGGPFSRQAAWRQGRLARRRAGRVARQGRGPRRRHVGRQRGALWPSGLGADVTILEVDVERMRFLDITMSASHTLYSSEAHLTELLPAVDLLIGAVLVPGAKAPRLISRAMLRSMKPGQRLRRHRHRPGRLRGDLAAHHARRPDLFRGRRAALLRREHAPAPTPAPRRRR